MNESTLQNITNENKDAHTQNILYTYFTSSKDRVAATLASRAFIRALLFFLTSFLRC